MGEIHRESIMNNWLCFSSGKCTATFVDNEKNRFPNTVAVKIDDNTYIFGRNTMGLLKMVAVDSRGYTIMTRHLGPQSSAPDVVTKENWEKGTGGGRYNVENIQMDCIGKAI